MADRLPFEFCVATLKRLTADATGLGRDQLTLNRWSLELGGHCRTGFEDNVCMDEHALAPSDAVLVTRVARLCEEYGRWPATAAETGAILGLAAA